MTLTLLNGLGSLLRGALSNFTQSSGEILQDHQQSLQLQSGLVAGASNSAAMTADARVDTAIIGMTTLLDGRVELGIIGGYESTMGGLMGSAVSLQQLVSAGVHMTETQQETVNHPDGSTTVTVTTTHTPGLQMVQALAPTRVNAPAQATAALTQQQIAAGGTQVADTLPGFSTDLPAQVPDYVALGALSPALGSAMVPAWSLGS
jgi:hypothetical protein